MKKYLIILITFIFLSSCQNKDGEYVCPPCNLPCDNLTFEKPGICPHCKMTLVKKRELFAESNLIVNEIDLKKGSGVFLIEGLNGEEEKSLKVYYHKPLNFSDTSNILLVIPGAGRNGDEYRDSWKENSEKYNVLILSPTFEEEKYPFEDYHLCGVIQELNIEQAIEYIKGTNQVKLNDETFSFQINLDKDKWIFNHFDKIFNSVVKSENSKQTSYDIFGHSAGGQILHRMALLHQKSKTNKILVANSGFYTLPDFDTELPFGINGLNLSSKELIKSFSKNLTVIVGELDNANETNGTILRSSIVDKQGTHRLARAKYFFNFCKSKAEQLNTDFNWNLEIVPQVGHNHALMANAAAKLLYE